MTPQERATQIRVGIFMMIGLCMIAAMVVYFGRFGDSVRKYYRVTVDYPNASGLLKGASVLLAGAKVGLVETSPVMLPDMDGVSVGLIIYQEVKLPSASQFTIGSSGLLGDKFVEVDLLKGAKGSAPIEAGAVIKGKGETGISDLVDEAGPLVAEVHDTVKRINSIATKLDDDILKESTIKDINASVANLKATTASFADTSKKINDVVDKAKSVLNQGSDAMASTKSAADELKKTIVDVHAVVTQTKQGRGALGLLLGDRATAENIRVLVENLRKKGILFYKDVPATGH